MLTSLRIGGDLYSPDDPSDPSTFTCDVFREEPYGDEPVDDKVKRMIFVDSFCFGSPERNRGVPSPEITRPMTRNDTRPTPVVLRVR